MRAEPNKMTSSSSKSGEEQEPSIKGSETAPFLYVEDFWDAYWNSTVAKFRLVRSRRSDDPSDSEVMEVVAILAISPKNLAEVHEFIGHILERMKVAGVDVTEAGKGEE